MSVKKCAARDSDDWWRIQLEKHTPLGGFFHTYWKITIYEVTDEMKRDCEKNNKPKIADPKLCESKTFYIVGLYLHHVLGKNEFLVPDKTTTPSMFCGNIVCYDNKKRTADQVFDKKNGKVLTRKIEIKDAAGFD